ncbi:MAG: hypothetical protein HC860_13630 [Alkalinema sp. RU_4_3]|nr:hypothetical protein [Alkalinema sp. RU_4_3]
MLLGILGQITGKVHGSILGLGRSPSTRLARIQADTAHPAAIIDLAHKRIQDTLNRNSSERLEGGLRSEVAIGADGAERGEFSLRNLANIKAQVLDDHRK